MFPKLLKLSILFVLLLAGYNIASASFTVSRPPTLNAGLVGHWTFDGKNVVNGVVLDSTANANNGNLVGIATSTFYSAGKIGQGFNFDGTNDYASITNESSFDFERTDSFSVSAWVKVASTALENTFFSKEGAAPSYPGWGFYVRPTALRVAITNKYDAPTNDIIKDSAIQVDDNKWHNVAFTYNGTSLASGVNIYVDGALSNGTVISDDLSTSILNNVSPNIGRGSWGGSYFKGGLDDVRVYNRALSAGEIKSLYNQGASKFNKTPTNILTNGLVGHWTFDGKNVVNGVALDSSGNGNKGNLINIATSTFYSAGKIGQGFNFDGVNDYADMGDVAILDGATALTLTAWINVDDLSAVRTVVNKWDDANLQSYSMTVLTTGEIQLEVLKDGSNYVGRKSNAGLITTSAGWQHIAATWSGGLTAKFYVNGVSGGDNASYSAGNPTTVSNKTISLKVGKYGNTETKYFDGQIDDVRIYNRALSAGEIKMLYNMGR